MKDLVVDTGRSKWEQPRRMREKRDPMYWYATKEKMRPMEWTYGTTFGDRLSPLFRWLESNCGRPWDDVYSEFCAVTDRRSIRGHHLWTHLDGYVDWGQSHLPYKSSWFYVNDEGLLTQRKNRRRW
jgi:hypothetical protein